MLRTVRLLFGETLLLSSWTRIGVTGTTRPGNTGRTVNVRRVWKVEGVWLCPPSVHPTVAVNVFRRTCLEQALEDGEPGNTRDNDRFP